MGTYSCSLVQLCCGKGETLQRNTAGLWGGGAHSKGTTLGLHSLSSMYSLVPTAQTPGCSARALSQVGPAFRALPWSKLLWLSGTPQGPRPRLAVRFALCPSYSGNQVLDECTAPGGPWVLSTSLVLGAPFPRCAAGAQAQLCRVSPLGNWSQAVTLLADLNHPGSQDDVIGNL